MMTLQEFWYEQNKEEFTREETDKILIEIFAGVQEENRHFGDCILECNSCLMCELHCLLDEYWEYTQQNHPRLKNRK